MSDRGFSLRAIVLIAVLAMVMVACGDDDTADTTTIATTADTTADTGQETAPETSTTTSEESVPEDTPSVVRFGDEFKSESLDPDKASRAFELVWLTPVYDTLIRTLPNGDLAPGLATSWEWIDATTFELQLREGVLFHDGTPFDGEAVKKNLERTLTFEGTSARVRGSVEAIEVVEVIEPLRVRILLTEPSVGLPFNLAALAGLMVSPAALDGSTLDSSPVGTGPYVIADYRPGDQAIYERFDDHWDDAVDNRASRLEIVSMDAVARFNALRSGQIDLAQLEVRQVQEAEAAGFTVEIGDSLGVWVVHLNTARGPLTDPLVRTALNHMVDREAIVEQLAFGIGQATIQLFPPDYFGFNDSFDLAHFPYDPVRAADLLDQAGFPNGIDLELLVLNRPDDVLLAELIQALFGESGARIALRIVDPAEFRIYTEGDVDMMIGHFGGRPNPDETLDVFFGGGFFNPSDEISDGMALLIAEAQGAIFGSAAYIQAVTEASGLGVEEALRVPLFIRSIPFAHDGCVGGFEPAIFGAQNATGLFILPECR